MPSSLSCQVYRYREQAPPDNPTRPAALVSVDGRARETVPAPQSESDSARVASSSAVRSPYRHAECASQCVCVGGCAVRHLHGSVLPTGGRPAMAQVSTVVSRARVELKRVPPSYSFPADC